MTRALGALTIVTCCAASAFAQPGMGGEETGEPKKQVERQPAGPLGIRLQPKVNPPTVKEVFGGTTAQAIGIAVGDVIVSIDGVKTPTVKALVKAYRGKKRWAGDTIEVALTRGGKAQTRSGPLLAKKTLVGKPAPAWGLKAWHNLPKGEKQGPTLASLKGKTVVLLAFLSWCPNCQRQALPAHAKLEQAFPDRSKVVFVYAQTVYEGYQRNGWRAGVRDLERLGLKGPMAHDPGAPDGRKPELMKRYKTGGTPWSIVIDPKGIVRYTGKTPALPRLKALIQKLSGVAPQPPKPIK